MKYILTLLNGLLLAPLAMVHSANPAQPNIVIILADDLGYSDLGVLWRLQCCIVDHQGWLPDLLRAREGPK